MGRPRLLIADDHPLILEGLRRLLENEYDIIGAASDGRSLVATAERQRPDVVLVDIAMPLLNGIEAIRQMRAALPHTRAIVITQQTGRQYIQEAFRAGAYGYVIKQSAAAELVTAIRQVIRGHLYVSESLRALVPPGFLHSAESRSNVVIGALTQRQREVLQLVAEGMSVKEIAELLRISPKTVEYHKAGIMDELGLRTTAELTRYALANGIVQT
jgi:DNA-binding NarL/FixJ family response regulator